MKTFTLVALLLVLPTPSFAQSTAFDRAFPPLPTSARHAASVASWATLGLALSLDAARTLHDHCRYPATDCRRAWMMTGLRIGVNIGATSAIKRAVHRTRPCAPSCGVDAVDRSFPSGHTALAFSTLGEGSVGTFVPLAVGTGALRVLAGKHYMSDVLAASAIGIATSRIR